MWYTGTADDNVSISAELASAGYIPIKLDVYLNTENGNVYQYLSNGDTLSCSCGGICAERRARVLKFPKHTRA